MSLRLVSPRGRVAGAAADRLGAPRLEGEHGVLPQLVAHAQLGLPGADAQLPLQPPALGEEIIGTREIHKIVKHSYCHGVYEVGSDRIKTNIPEIDHVLYII